MRTIKVSDCFGIEHDCEIYTPIALPISELIKGVPIVKSGRRKYYNIACAFDIETTSFRYEDDEPDAFMYHWQFCMHDTVCFGRTWEQFQELLSRLRQYCTGNLKFLVWVHNLSFEFQFMKHFIGEIENMFARETRSPVSVQTFGVEFRCSYYLTNMSLATFTRNSKGCIFWKKKDTYDYRKFRTPYTAMTESEEEYCYCDVRGLCEAIESKMMDETLDTFPLTSTGYVRRAFRDRCLPRMWEIINNMRLTEQQYELCKQAFRGGDTGANVLYVGDIMENIDSYDKKSSYPASMMYDKFPMSAFKRLEKPSADELYKLMELGKACLIRFAAGVKVKNMDTHAYIDKGHCRHLYNGRFDNGRVLSAEYLEYTCTDIDFDIILKHYNMYDIEILDLYYAEYGYLPREFREYLGEMFKEKCHLQIEKMKPDLSAEERSNAEELYAKYKNMINASFGMMVTDINTPEIIYENDEWIKQPADIKESLDKYYANHNNFLAYQWGVWVTANARRNLHDGMDAVGIDCLYTDTDSIKCRQGYSDVFARLNNSLKERAAKVKDVEVFPTINGKTFYLGLWDYEGTYNEFRTWGSKKYAYTEDGILHITVAGLNKSKGAEYLTKCGGIKAFIAADGFKKGWEVPEEYSGRTTAYYIEHPIRKLCFENHEFVTAGGIAIFNTTYKLGITDEYLELILENDKWDSASMYTQ